MKTIALKIYNFFRKVKNIGLVFFFLTFSLTILSSYLSPAVYPYLAPFSLLFFPLFLFNIVVFFLYFKRNKWISIPSLILVILSIHIFLNVFTYNTHDDKKGIKIMSWNVKNFDLYNWTNNLKTRQQMMKMIDSIHPDIICLQEFFTNDFEYNNLKTIQDMGYKHYCFYPSYIQKKANNQWGLAIFSKHPIEKRDLIDILPEKSAMNQCIYAQVEVKGVLYNIYNAHFQSIHLGYQDYDYINDVEHKFSMMDANKSWKIFSKITIAYQRRVQQVQTFLNYYQKSKKSKTILCTDLNDVPSSYTYALISNKLTDAFKQKGSGMSNTIDFIFPMFRIDYFFTSKDVNTNSYLRLKTKLSDHHILILDVD